MNDTNQRADFYCLVSVLESPPEVATRVMVELSELKE
jgi:hypothetical protein